MKYVKSWSPNVTSSFYVHTLHSLGGIENGTMPNQP